MILLLMEQSVLFLFVQNLEEILGNRHRKVKSNYPEHIMFFCIYRFNLDFIYLFLLMSTLMKLLVFSF